MRLMHVRYRAIHATPRRLLAGVSALAALATTVVLAGEPGQQDSSARPATDPGTDRAAYLDREAERAAARNNADYGRYDRADRDRARNAAQDRMDAHLGRRWLVGGYVNANDGNLQVVRDYRGHGMRRPPRGSHWMRDGRGDLLLVVISSGMISEVVPYD